MQETDLYAPIKRYLQAQGYEVKAEVLDCDIVARRGDEAPVIVEMKRALSLALLLQGVDRQAITDAVYVAVPRGAGARWRGQIGGLLKLCRRLGLGLISVRLAPIPALVEVHLDPGPYRPRLNNRRKSVLLREFSRRVGDPNTGGQTRRPIVTAYRQDALRLAAEIAKAGTGRPAHLAQSLGIKAAGSILQRDHYGWFDREARGVYRLSAAGQQALVAYGDVLEALARSDGQG